MAYTPSETVSPVLIDTLSGKKTRAGKLTPISSDWVMSKGLSKLFTGSFSQLMNMIIMGNINLIECKNKP